LGKTGAMSFGQPPGPPASAKQVQELLCLLRDAGHSDFRDARGPMGFTQRQAAGKFARLEAAEFIERLQEVERGANPFTEANGRGPTGADPELSDTPSGALAAELRRRGWSVDPP
jgi:hypothetical protein